MLESIRGTLVRKDEDSAVIETSGGVAFALEIPTSTFALLPEPDDEATVYTHLNFNPQDGEFSLFGFATGLEREVFRIFIQISGIGPRKGLMILSQIRIEEFAAAIRDRNLAYLSKIKGVGPKTAERLLLELREKMLPYAGAGGGGAAGPATGTAGVVLPDGANVRDAVAGMVSLGVRLPVAAQAIAKAVESLGSDAPSAELIRRGLKHR